MLEGPCILFRFCFCDGPVEFVDLSLPELSVQLLEGLGIPGKEDHPCHRLIDPMNQTQVGKARYCSMPYCGFSSRTVFFFSPLFVEPSLYLFQETLWLPSRVGRQGGSGIQRGRYRDIGPLVHGQDPWILIEDIEGRKISVDTGCLWHRRVYTIFPVLSASPKRPMDSPGGAELPSGSCVTE